jgi:hypothetical protein
MELLEGLEEVSHRGMCKLNYAAYVNKIMPVSAEMSRPWIL